MKKLTTSNFKMAFTKILAQSLNFNMLKTKISCDIWFFFERVKKEAKFPILPSNFDNSKNFASKWHRIKRSTRVRLNLVLFESSHDGLLMVKITLMDKDGFTKILIFESWALKNQWFPSVEARTYASPPTHGHLGQIRRNLD